MGPFSAEKLPLLLFLVTVGACLATALHAPKQPRNHEDLLGNKDSAEGLRTWHGLDYAFDHSQWNDSDYVSYEYSGSDEDEYEDDEKDKHDHHITLAGKKLTTSKPEPAPAGQVILSSSPFTFKKVETTLRPNSKSVSKPGKVNIVPDYGDYDWKETEGDSDDGLGKSGSGNEGKQKLGQLPTDNDSDKEKYFAPDKYMQRFTLHNIEDILMGKWTVHYPESNLPCIMLRGDIKLIVPLNPTWHNRDFITITVPEDAEASGACNSLNNDYQEIILNWNVSAPDHGMSYKNTITFGFARNWTSEFSEMNIPEDKYALVAVTATYYRGEIEQEARSSKRRDDGIISYSANDLVEFLTPINQSMSCMKDKQFILGSMQLSLSNIQLEAFRPNSDTLSPGEFSRSVLCSNDEIIMFDAVMTFIIWFWIGGLLIVLLIFIVLIAFGYRKKRTSEGGFGYKILSV